MTPLVAGVCEIELAQQGVRGDFSGAHEIPTAIRFDFGEAQQPAGARLLVAPDEPLDGSKPLTHRIHSLVGTLFAPGSSVCLFSNGSGHSCARICAEAAITLGGIIVLIWAATADKAWVDRHFLPYYFHPQAHRYAVVLVVRFIAAAAGLTFIFWLRPYVGRAIAAGNSVALVGGALPVLIAIVLALLVSEAVLRTSVWRARHQAPTHREPIQQPNARLGWVLVPDHAGTRFMGGRTVEYATERFGYRVRCAGCSVDMEQPSILFTGESIMLGTGLQWNESVPALVGQRLGVQGVNLAVNGYASDQAYLRLATELPRFKRPVAVVTLFMSPLFPRNLQVDRPHLDANLVWHPAVIPWRLQALAERLLKLKYSSAADLEQAVAMTRAALQATARLAHSRGAAALVLVPQFPLETRIERDLQHRILDEGGIDYVVVDLDPSWRLSDDAHPNARAARAMADAIAARLREMRSTPPD